MPPIGVLIKPASSKCNMRCEYCFYHSLAANRLTGDFGFMSGETLEAIIRKVLEFAEGEATFSFQGGEPTLCGIEFYRKAVTLQQQYNVNSVRINNCIQTNGILIDDDWARFLSAQSFLVGLSLDGPGEIHNANRVDAQGKGTFRRVMQTVDLLNKHRADYNILFVVAAAGARSPDKLYSFFQEHDFRFLQFIPCIEPTGAGRGTHGYALTPDRFESFLKRMFDRWSGDVLSGSDVSIRYFDNLVRVVMGAQPETCSMLGQCQCQLVFESDGSVYPCDFYVTDRWRMGSIHEQSAAELFRSAAGRDFVSSSVSARSLCQGCNVFPLCRGGCRRDRENSVTGEIERNTYCSAYKGFLQYAYPKLVEIARFINRKYR